MSLFSSVFGKSENQNSSTTKINWIPLTDIGQLDAIVLSSIEKPVVIFKHSTRCSVSRMALKQFENEFELEEKVDAYFLDLIEYRTVSNEIASRFDVFHQSPQLLLIKNGKSIYDVSHNEISAGDLISKI
jgi:bacillithiol system protein YtxJ